MLKMNDPFPFPTDFIAPKQYAITYIPVRSTAFDNESLIPSKYIYDNGNTNPPLYLEKVPDGSQSLALIMEDLDAWKQRQVHWLVWDIPVTNEIGENTSLGIKGLNVFNQYGYVGPRPFAQKHRYVFKVYALKQFLGLPVNSSLKEVETAVENNVIGFGQLVGVCKEFANKEKRPTTLLECQ